MFFLARSGDDDRATKLNPSGSSSGISERISFVPKVLQPKAEASLDWAAPRAQ
jgi:hypothetical protein